MTEFLTTAAIGLLVSILGIVNMTGNISTLHSYHRKRVSEENRKPFGRLVGLGTLIIGISLIIFSVMQLASEKTEAELYTIIGTALLILGVAVGAILSVYAIKKYNGSIF